MQLLHESIINTCFMGRVTLPTSLRSDVLTWKGAGALSKEWVLYTWLLWSQENTVLVSCFLASSWEMFHRQLCRIHLSQTAHPSAQNPYRQSISFRWKKMFFRKDLLIATFPNSMQALKHLLRCLSHMCFAALVWLDFQWGLMMSPWPTSMVIIL